MRQAKQFGPPEHTFDGAFRNLSRLIEQLIQLFECLFAFSFQRQQDTQCVQVALSQRELINAKSPGQIACDGFVAQIFGGGAQVIHPTEAVNLAALIKVFEQHRPVAGDGGNAFARVFVNVETAIIQPLAQGVIMPGFQAIGCRPFAGQ